ncbi:AI-2E family transporter [Francisella halioticida]|uniref:AI-2E family transporter n=1 Tax=Francisella halioticida TaxID=549298 RepID=A0ABM6LYH0_9GAMM|nr:AI-2E family transporter [Francisella halioticida]ASG67699.1 AI-2E family transporter [Francisella halioticida]BCD90267.1 AI-2E family transporter [Francisella halioticida]
MVLKTIKNWYRDRYQNNEPIVFIGLMLFFYLVLTFLGNYIAPILAALVIAYLLDTFVNILYKVTKINRLVLVYFAYIIFLIVLFSVIFVLLPIIVNQMIDFIKQASHTLSSLKISLEHLSQQYPKLLTVDIINSIVSWFDTIDWKKISSSIGSFILQNTATTLPIIFSALIYLFLVPLMVFYFLKDKDKIISWFNSFLPEDNHALFFVWNDLKPKLADYVRGKAIEFIIVSIATYLGFAYFNLNYSILLAFGVGLSVIIPYVGMVMITIPVIMVGILQYGISITLVWMLIVFFIIQALDGNLLVPLLFSEILNMHPVGVVSAILIFGGMWGLWGVFFAIPLGLLFISGVNMFRNHQKCKKDPAKINLC